MREITVQERRQQIIEMLIETGRVNVAELSEIFGVSSVIIRGDLAELEKQDMLLRVHGGAITSYKSYYDMNLMQRLNANSPEKTAIALKIAELIKDNQTIIMNAGSTPMFVMRAIENKKVTIVTNSIALALEGSGNPNFKIILLGGDVDSEYQFTYGTTALSLLEQYSAELFILSVDGIDVDSGISTFYHQEAEICRKMIERSGITIVAADNTKIGRKAFAKISPLSSVDTLVTNNKSSDKHINELKEKGIEIILA